MLHARLWVVLCLYIYSIFVLIYVLVSNYAFIHLFKKMKQVRLCIYCAHLLFDHRYQRTLQWCSMWHTAHLIWRINAKRHAQHMNLWVTITVKLQVSSASNIRFFVSADDCSKLVGMPRFKLPTWFIHSLVYSKNRSFCNCLFM